MAFPVPAVECRNCGAPLAGRYCSSCGQRERPLDPALHELWHEIVHEFAHLDGKIVGTLRALLSPGLLTSEFLSGRRSRYIGPVRLYLTFSVLFFLVLAVVPRLPGREILKISAGSGQRAAESWLARAAEKARENPRHLEHAFFTNTSRAMFVLVPLFAAVLRLIYRRAGRRYPAFVYFSLHYHSFVFGVYGLAGLAAYAQSRALSDGAGTVAFALSTGYLFLALRRVFGGSRRSTAMRMAAAACLYFPCLLAGIGAAVVVSLLAL